MGAFLSFSSLRRLVPACFLILCLALSGCGAFAGGKTYNDGDIRTVQHVQTGTVIDVTEVMVKDKPSLVGPIVGGVAGGVIGSLFGAGSGKTLATLGGAAGGALLGGAAEAGVRRYKASQITIELEGGEVIMVVQGNDEYFVRGDQVRVIGVSEGRARVQHL